MSTVLIGLMTWMTDSDFVFFIRKEAMFLKGFHIKSNTAIKGSDRKKVRQLIIEHYGDKVSEDDVMKMVPNKGDMSVKKILTSDQTTVILYCLDRTPMWFQIEEHLYPTVYTLWQQPELIQPVFVTHRGVLSNLLSGADLMLPGVILSDDAEPGPNQLGKFDKGKLCAVRLEGNMCPIGLGHTLLSSYDMFMSCMRGKGVSMLHLYKDQLWATATNKNDPPLIEEPACRGADEDPMIQTDAQNEVLENTGSTCEAGSSEIPDETCYSAEGLELAEELASTALEDEADAASEGTTLSSTEQMDELLYRCLCQSIKYKAKKTDLPVLDSQFYRNYILTCCGPGEMIDIKKSSYRKVSKFLHSMADRGLLQLSTISKGVEQITQINKQHQDVDSIEAVVENPPVETPSSSVSPNTQKAPPAVTNVYFVNAATLPFFRISVGPHITKGSFLTAQQVRQYLTGYVRVKQLNSSSSKGCIELDDVLGDLVLNKNERLSVERLQWDEVMRRCIQRMSPGYQVQLATDQEPLVKKGALEPITLNVLQRAGNKKVTLITNLEVYGVTPQEFASVLQKTVQASCSVSGVGDHKPGMMQVMCQGNQVNTIARLLTEDYKIHKKHLKGLEKGIKEKKPGGKKKG